jgi:hypothetical protein
VVSGKSEYVDSNGYFVIEDVGSDVSESLLDRIRRLQCEDSECKELRDYLSVRILSTSPDRAKTIGKHAKLFAMVDDTLVFTNSKTERVHFCVVLPKVMRMSVMYMFHDYPLYGAHMGMIKVYDKIRGRFYWTNMYSDILEYVRACKVCQSAKGKQLLNSGLLGTILATFPFEVIGMDFIDPLPRTARGYEYILTIICLFLKWAEAFPLVKATAKECAKAFVHGFLSRHGCPLKIVSDRGQAFVGKIMSQVCVLLSIKKLNTSPYHPPGNGCTEKFNGTLESMIRSLIGNDHTQWDILLPLILLAYRTSTHSSAGFSPFLITTGREAILPTDIALALNEYRPKNVQTYVKDLKERLVQTFQAVSKNLGRAHLTNQEQYDGTHKHVSYNVGDYAWLYVVRRAKAKQTAKLLHP